METRQGIPAPDEELHRKRTKSSVLKTFIHKRTLSNKGTTAADYSQPESTLSTSSTMPLSLSEHLYSRALGELQRNEQTPLSSRTKHSVDERGPSTSGEELKPLHKKTKSAISLKSLTGKEADKHQRSNDNKSKKMKKQKSSTNLATLLTRPRSSKNLKKTAEEEERRLTRDKENRTPPNSPESYPPIYAQFATQNIPAKPLNGKFIEDEIDLYTPQDYSPGKQRNFYGDLNFQPTLGQRDGAFQRRSMILPDSFSMQDISRYVTGVGRRSADQSRRVSTDRRNSSERMEGILNTRSAQKTKLDSTTSKRGSRVIAAVTSLGTKRKGVESEQGPDFKIKNIDVEFEAMLDRRNIPEHQRHKMRKLAVSMKIDFIKQDWAETAVTKSRPGANEINESDSAAATENAEVMTRPRSRTFTLSKSSKDLNLATKKSKPDPTPSRHSRTKSSSSTTSHNESTTSGGGGPLTSNSITKANSQLPNDFVLYLQKFPNPEIVEVGKIHKLRLLLRNETVAWTDEFIGSGGMDEIVGLLHRTMEVEWREEHEDALLHEALLCLKALCTTDLALQNLTSIQCTLFPALIHMLFDEEKKGPSEYTTRNIITSLLFTYLKSATLAERPLRARTLLSYLRDPEPKEDQRPIGFVLKMRRERPYRVWCKEVVSVTKEVFWIFLHNLNVISLPPSAKNRLDGERECEQTTGGITGPSRSVSINPPSTPKSSYSYMLEHFPQELPPVPAAPYVGGVEWDATNYLASHLDLINGILASLETREDRDKLREHLQVSGWERCMGSTLRLCKEKFYGGVHAALRTWVAAAYEDGWDIRDVRCGPPVETKPIENVKNKSPRKRKGADAPILEMPKLNFTFEKTEEGFTDGGWL